MSSSDTFVYGLVAHGTKPLAELALSDRKFGDISLRMLAMLDPKDRLSEGEVNGRVFYACSEPDRMVFLCITEKKATDMLRRMFLDDMRAQWKAKYGNQGSSFQSYQKNDEFGPTIRTLMGTYNMDRARKIAVARERLYATQEESAKNVTRALARGEQLDIMSQKAEDVKKSAQTFRREAANVKSLMCFQKWRCYILAAVLVVVAIIVIVVMV